MLSQLKVADTATRHPRSLKYLGPYNAMTASLSDIVIFTGLNILYSSPLLSKNFSCTVDGCSFMKCHVLQYKKKHKNSVYGSISSTDVVAILYFQSL